MYKNLCLAMVLHDPHSFLYDAIVENETRLRDSRYTNKYVAISNETNKSIVDLLLALDFTIYRVEKRGAGNARRDLLKNLPRVKNRFYHYCDFDRFLTWIKYHSEELDTLNSYVETNLDDYTIIGRTLKAFNTHPLSWIETEKISNELFSDYIGFNCDVTAGSSIINTAIIELIVNYSNRRVTDVEWPLLLKEYKIGYYCTNGLRFTDYNKTFDDHSINSWISRLELTTSIAVTIKELGEDCESSI
ncbi:hypothetical protein [Shouchella hunanensis]|uniref:DUF4435 domain-containing protein n=1 Tax=Shouchella hunanensis TaxID=766894 RepID=A0ABY7W5P9_9BACI|nr:hypothetical protein [Shouchella hunanensis]WDF03177.1 hypothetical protein PQ477_17030 [Shouchella hunanensis]